MCIFDCIKLDTFTQQHLHTERFFQKRFVFCMLLNYSGRKVKMSLYAASSRTIRSHCSIAIPGVSFSSPCAIPETGVGSSPHIPGAECVFLTVFYTGIRDLLFNAGSERLVGEVTRQLFFLAIFNEIELTQLLRKWECTLNIQEFIVCFCKYCFLPSIIINWVFLAFSQFNKK